MAAKKHSHLGLQSKEITCSAIFMVWGDRDAIVCLLLLTSLVVALILLKSEQLDITL